VHRIGRTGRAGRSGRALTIALPHEEKHVEKIEKLIGKTIAPIELPGEARRARRAEEPAEVPEPARPERGREPARAERSREAAPEASRAAPERPAGDRRERHRGGDRAGDRGGAPVVGLGDHVPAFLLRAVRLPKTARAVEADEAA
jgi:superfamily II DNA/RNA helicase